MNYVWLSSSSVVHYMFSDSVLATRIVKDSLKICFNQFKGYHVGNTYFQLSISQCKCYPFSSRSDWYRLQMHKKFKIKKLFYPI